MKQHGLFAYSLYEEQAHHAELELSSYVKAVADRFEQQFPCFAEAREAHACAPAKLRA